MVPLVLVVVCPCRACSERVLCVVVSLDSIDSFVLMSGAKSNWMRNGWDGAIIVEKTSDFVVQR